ncbi:MAG: amidase family protein [Nanoarchaeota archaeon]
MTSDMSSISFIKKIDDKHKIFTTTCDVHEKQKGPLSKYTVSLKDALWLEGIETTASSAILKGFKPVEHSTVAEKILDAGARIVGKTVQDEFGFGTFSVNVGYNHKVPLNPYDVERCAGGSSGGAAVAAALIDKHISIAESTGGSIVTPASFCGVVGICPTYGRVSRNGLITYSSSLDKIGTMSKKVYESALMLEVISGLDARDETSADAPVEKFSDATEDSLEKTKNMKIAILETPGINEEIMKKFEDTISCFSKAGVKFEKIKLPYMSKYALSAYYIIAMSEASTHLACLSGLRYGKGEKLDESAFYNEYFEAVRTKNFNDETKRRILLGTFTRMSGYRGEYYMKALKVRKKIIDEYKEVFKKYDAITLPTAPVFAPKFSEINKMSLFEIYNLDYLGVGPNLAGLPHISVPINKDGELPCGILFVGDHFSESKLISLGSAVEVLQ